MKILSKLALVLTILLTVVTAKAGGFGYHSSSSRGYVYRNPYAATPTVRVHDYFRRNGAYVPSYRRTAPNWTATDNLNYRGYGTIRVPRDRSW